MGVQNFLPNLVGRPIDLCHYADVFAPDRSLRVAIDVSSVIYKATQGFADMLTDERHLDNYGRAQLIYQQQEERMASGEDADDADDSATAGGGKQANSVPNPIYEKQVEKYALNCTMFVMKYIQRFIESNIDILVVFDGQTPPIKVNQVKARSNKQKKAEAERNAPVDKSHNEDDIIMRIRASRRAGAGKHFRIIIDSIIQALRTNRIPFLVAPYESDGQLAFLSVHKYVDLIVTEDSDLVACGASPILYKTSMKKEHQSNEGIEGTLIRAEDLACAKKFDLMDVSSAMLATIFVAAGSDYCEKLKGVGMMRALQGARKYFHEKPSKGDAPLRLFLNYLYSITSDDLTEDDKEAFEEQFLGALLMFRHPVVYNPIAARCEYFRLSNPDPELMLYEPYAALLKDEVARARVVGSLTPSPKACYIAEGWLDPRTLEPRQYAVFPEHVDAFYKDLCKTTGRPAHLTTPSKSRPTSITTALFSVEDPKTMLSGRRAAGGIVLDAGIEGRRLNLDAADLETQPQLSAEMQDSQSDSILSSRMGELAVEGQAESSTMEFETQPMIE